MKEGVGLLHHSAEQKFQFAGLLAKGEKRPPPESFYA